MSQWEVRALTQQVVVEAPNWLMAVSQALPGLGHAGASMSDLVCDIQVDGVVRIFDPRSDLALLVRVLSEGSLDRPHHAEPVGVAAVGVGVAAVGAELERFDEVSAAEELSEEPAGPAEETWQGSEALSTLELPPPSNLPAAAQEFSRPIPSLGEGAEGFDDDDLAFFESLDERSGLESAPEGIAERLFMETSSIGDASDLPGAARAALDVLLGVVEAEAGAVLFANLNDTGLRFLAAVGPEAAQLEAVAVPFGEGIAGFVHDTGASLLVLDAAHDPRHHGDVDDRTGYRTASLLAAAIRDVDGTIHGCIELLNPPRRFEAWQLDAAKSVAAALAEEIRVRF